MGYYPLLKGCSPVVGTKHLKLYLGLPLYRNMKSVGIKYPSTKTLRVVAYVSGQSGMCSAAAKEIRAVRIGDIFCPRLARFVKLVSRYGGGVLLQFVNFNSPGNNSNNR